MDIVTATFKVRVVQAVFESKRISSTRKFAEALDKMNITDKVSDEVSGLIRKRCTRARQEFRT